MGHTINGAAGAEKANQLMTTGERTGVVPFFPFPLTSPFLLIRRFFQFVARSRDLELSQLAMDESGEFQRRVVSLSTQNIKKQSRIKNYIYNRQWIFGRQVGETEGVRWKGYPCKELHAAAFRVAKTP